MQRPIRGAALALIITFGCGASLASILATVPGVVTTILKVVDEVSEFLAPQLDDAGKAELAEIVKGIHDTAAILEAAADGSLSLTEGEVSAAFDRLEELYKRLVNFGGKYGVRYSDDGRVSASGSLLRVPKYEAIK